MRGKREDHTRPIKKSRSPKQEAQKTSVCVEDSVEILTQHTETNFKKEERKKALERVLPKRNQNLKKIIVIGVIRIVYGSSKLCLEQGF